MNLNKIQVIGRIGQVEIIATKDGGKVLKFSLATNESRKVNDVWESETTWFNCVVFGKAADWLSEKLKKGLLLYVDGKMKNNSYTNKLGEKRDFWQIVTKDVKIMEKQESNQSNGYNKSNNDNNSTSNDIVTEFDENGDIPF